ncbi:hypothetical protein AYO38_07455 [bacterium SCGC AG-212-C10]|nr:hypothetical protein AYO38_07455 [bacterium SCGC AG-212-C10]
MGDSATTLRRLGVSDARAAGQVLGRAFWDDPMSVYLLPDDDHRTAALPHFMTVGALIGMVQGEVWSRPEAMEGAAVWVPPGAQGVPDDSMGDALAEMAVAFGPEALERANGFFAAMGGAHGRNMGETPHWYLMILGVDPPRQGTGVGSGLIAPVLTRADEAGMPVYLETMKAKNVPFYERHGFTVLEEADHETLHYWAMRREPKSR